MSHDVRVVLPEHLRQLAQVGDPLVVTTAGAPTIRAVLDALEAQYPMLRGTIRQHGTLRRRDFVRFFVCEEDWSHESVDRELPGDVASGRQPLLIVGAMAGG